MPLSESRFACQSTRDPGLECLDGDGGQWHLALAVFAVRELQHIAFPIDAGPGRVRQWLRGANHLSYDVWVENIPFDETRQYVQNVLSYSVIYGEKLNAPQPLVAWHERYFDQ